MLKTGYLNLLTSIKRMGVMDVIGLNNLYVKWDFNKKQLTVL